MVAAWTVGAVEDVDTLLVYADGDAQPLTRLTGDSIPPTLAGFLAAWGSGLRQSAGALGAFVFAANSVHACKPGATGVKRLVQCQIAWRR